MPTPLVGLAASTLRVGPLTLMLEICKDAVAGQSVRLTGKEYATLELLVARKGTVLTKRAIFNHLYGGAEGPEMRIIDLFICKIRKKLAAAGAENLIETVWGRGYMLRDTEAAPETDGTTAHHPWLLVPPMAGVFSSP